MDVKERLVLPQCRVLQECRDEQEHPARQPRDASPKAVHQLVQQVAELQQVARRQELAHQEATTNESALPQGQSLPVSSARLSQPLPSLLFQLWQPLPPALPLRRFPESFCALSQRRPRGSSSSASSFPLRRTPATGQ